jgi:hypothetical protein
MLALAGAGARSSLLARNPVKLGPLALSRFTTLFVIFALVWHQPWTHVVCWAGAVVMLTVWLWLLMLETMIVADLKDPAEQQRRGWALFLRDWPQTVVLVLGLAMMLWINYCGYLGVSVDPETGAQTFDTIAWPWFVPIGSTVAFVFGYLLARRKPGSSQPTTAGDPA